MELLKESDRDGLYIRHAITDAPTNKGAGFHIHDRCEVFCFIAGNAQYLVEGSVYPLERGSLLIMRPGEAHCIRFMSSERYERYAVNFPANLFDSFDPRRMLLSPFFSRPLGQQNLYNIPDIENSFRDLAYFEGGDYYRRVMFVTRLAALMEKLGQHDPRRQTAARTLSEKLVCYVNDMLCENVTVGQLAEHFFLSTSQFSRLFRTATGASPRAYITAKRLIKARELLQSGESAGKTAEECGFKDYSVFYKAYVKRYGEKPSGTA